MGVGDPSPRCLRNKNPKALTLYRVRAFGVLQNMKTEPQIRAALLSWQRIADMPIPVGLDRETSDELLVVKKEARWFAKGLEWVLEEA